MAQPGRGRSRNTEWGDLTPPGWLLLFLAASPLVRFQAEPWTVYPGHWALSLLLAVMLLRGQGAQRGQRFPLRAGLALGVYLAAMAAWREEPRLAAAAGGAVALNFFWGWAAYRWAFGRQGAGAAPDGVVLWLAAALAAGLVGWAAAFSAPALCTVFNCGPGWQWPAPFRAGWNDQAQWLLHLMFALPAVAPLVIQVSRAPGHGPERPVLYAMIALCGLALFAGAPWWALGIVALGLVLATRGLGGPRAGSDRRLLGRLALGATVQLLLLFALVPGYLALALGNADGAREVRVEQLAAAAGGLSSERTSVLRLRVTNPGLTPLLAVGEGGGSLRGRVLVTPRSGAARVFDAAPVPLAGRMAPKQSVEVALPLRLPHWVEDGFLTWHVEDAVGEALRLSGDSDLGFRFTNPGYRSLTGGTGNTLSALAARARDLNRTTVPAGRAAARSRRPGSLVGASLDTLFFSPLWGLAPKGATRFWEAGAPLWVQLWRNYGALGLLLAAWFAMRLVGQVRRVARQGVYAPDRLGWRLAPGVLGLLLVTGLFSPVLGSFHAVWGLFILAGYVEGRHDRLFPGRKAFAPPKPAVGADWRPAQPKHRWFVRKRPPWPKPRRRWWPRRRRRFF